jgi:hypothetical protein
VEINGKRENQIHGLNEATAIALKEIGSLPLAYMPIMEKFKHSHLIQEI